MKANMESTLKELGAHFGGNGNGNGRGANLSKLQKMLESSEHIPLDVYLAQLRSDVAGKPAEDAKTAENRKKHSNRLNRIASK